MPLTRSPGHHHSFLGPILRGPHRARATPPWLPWVGLALAAVLLAAPSAWAQTASLRVNVTDESGAVVPGASVTLTEIDTKAARHGTTGPEGSSYFAGLFPGRYAVKIELAGFKTHEQNLTINPQDTRAFDVKLEVGAQTEVVNVTTEATIVQTETGAREGLLTAGQIDNLSIIGRSSMELLRIMPGVVPLEQDQLQTIGFGSGANQTSGYTVNGVRGTNNVVTLDGSMLMDIGSNSGVIINPNPDMVESVKMLTSNYAAEHGTAGVQVSAISKGGSNEFHGSAYVYSRNHGLAANDRSNSLAGNPKPPSQFLYPGGNLSGPLIKDKLFFFGAFEYQRQRVDMGTRFGVVPTLAQRQGDFSEFANPVGDNLLQPTQVNIPAGYPGAGSPAPNNNLAPYIDPLGKVLINLYPQPDYSDSRNRYNYTGDELRIVDRWESMLRVDYNISETTKAYMRLAYSKETNDQPRGLWWDPGPYALPTPVRGTNDGISASLSVVSVISPTMTNEVLLSYSRLRLDNDFEDAAVMSPSTYGLAGTPGFYGQQVPYIPLNFGGWADQGMDWFSFNGNPMFAHNNALQFADTLTKVKDTHVLKFGVSIDQLNKEQNFQNENEGQMQYYSWGQPGATGSTIGNLLTGRPGSYTQGTILPAGHFRQYNFAGFVQDSWKIRRNFTLEAGLRAAFLPNNTEIQGLAAIFDPAKYDPNKGLFLDNTFQRVNGVEYAAKGDVPNRLVPNRGIFWMPRLNFAWDVKANGDLVVRGGAGVFYNRPQGNAEYDVMRIPPNAFHSYYSPWDGFTFNQLPGIDPFTILGGQDLISGNPAAKDYPRVTSTSLSVAKRIFKDNVFEVGYVGTFGRHLLNRREINVDPLGYFLKGTIAGNDLSNPVNRAALDNSITYAARPYPAYGSITFWEYASTSNYHSLQATLSQQTNPRFQYFLTYTFSKALGSGTVNETDGAGGLDPYFARDRTWGVLSTDRTHLANLSYNWMVPDLVGEKSSGFLKGLLNNWQISGISTFQSGQYIRPRFSGDITGGPMALAWEGTVDSGRGAGNITSGFVTPIIGKNVTLGGTSPGEKLLDIGQITIPTFPGSGPYNQAVYIRSPNRMFHDVTLMKNVPVGGGDKKLQLRFSCFNCFNMAFASPVVTNDIDLQLQTTCNVHVDAPNGIGGTSNVCDPEQGFVFTDQALRNFGTINLLRGHRVVELALKFYF
jgi:hypothetical protein